LRSIYIYLKLTASFSNLFKYFKIFYGILKDLQIPNRSAFISSRSLRRQSRQLVCVSRSYYMFVPISTVLLLLSFLTKYKKKYIHFLYGIFTVHSNFSHRCWPNYYEYFPDINRESSLFNNMIINYFFVIN